jgi:hypothetical protein
MSMPATATKWQTSSKALPFPNLNSRNQEDGSLDTHFYVVIIFLRHKTYIQESRSADRQGLRRRMKGIYLVRNCEGDTHTWHTWF